MKTISALTLTLVLSGCGSMLFNPLEVRDEQQRMECVARLLDLPVPLEYPKIHYVSKEDWAPRSFMGYYVEGNIYLPEGASKSTLIHELAHHVMHGHNLSWEENRANFVARKYSTWCVEK